MENGHLIGVFIPHRDQRSVEGRDTSLLASFLESHGLAVKPIHNQRSGLNTVRQASLLIAAGDVEIGFYDAHLALAKANEVPVFLFQPSPLIGPHRLYQVKERCGPANAHLVYYDARASLGLQFTLKDLI